MTGLTRVNLALGSYVSWVYVAVLVFTLYEVFMRYVMNAPTVWALELSLMLVAVGYAIGGVLPTAQQGHLRIDSLYGRFPRRLRKLCDVIANLVGVGYLAAVTWAGAAQAWTSISLGERSGSAWNSWLPMVQKGVIPVAGFLMMLQVLVFMFDRRTEDPSGASQADGGSGKDEVR